MLLALATLALLGAGPDYSVVVARRLGLEPKRAAELATSFAEALEQQPAHPLGTLLPVDEAAVVLERAGFPDTSVCNGSAACVSSLARVSGLSRIVALQLVKVGTELAIDVSVVEGSSGRILGVVTRSVKLKTASDALFELAAELVTKLPAPSDAPTEIALTPEPPPPPSVELTPPSLPTGRKVALGLGGGAVVALGIGVGLGVSALEQSKALSAADPRFEERAAAARSTALGADLTYGLAGALAVGALVTWLVSSP